MLSTQTVLRLLRDANPGIAITEDRVRHAIRRGDVRTPPSFAGRLLWTARDIEALSAALGLTGPPAIRATQPEVNP